MKKSRSGQDANVILVVDDQAENIKVVVETLAGADYITVVARSGAEGLRRAQFSQPDLILLDVMMSGLDGFETCRALKADPATRSIPVIFMTVADDIADKVRGFECGAVDYVTKPVQMQELLARVHTHLMIQALQCELESQNLELEARVRERTADLEIEIEQRKQREQEHLHLMEMLRNQSEQLRIFSRTLLQQNSSNQEQAAQLLQGQVVDDFESLEIRLKMLRQWQIQRESGDAETKVVFYIDETLGLLEGFKDWLCKLQQLLVVPAAKEDPLMELSPREQEVAHLIVTGKTSSEIADLLHLSVHTVRTYRRRLMKKLEIDSAGDLIKLLM